MLTVTVKPAVCPTAFDFAYDAACAAGWPGPAAFLACCTMKAAGLAEWQIQAAFVDAARRIQ